MFCMKCGKELQDGEQYCSNCGTKAGESLLKNTTGVDSQDVLANCVNALKTGLYSLGSEKNRYFFSIVLLIAGVFTIGKTMFEISADLGFRTYSWDYTMFEDEDSLKTIHTLLYWGAAAIMLIPMLMGKEWKKACFIPGMAAPAISVVRFVAVLIGAVNEAKESGVSGIAEEIGVSANLTTNAWIFLMISAAAIILIYKVCNNILYDQYGTKQRENENGASGAALKPLTQEQKSKVQGVDGCVDLLQIYAQRNAEQQERK